MKKDQDYPNILNQNEENDKNSEEPQTVIIRQPLNVVETQNFFVLEFKPNTMSQLNLLRFKRSLAKKIIKKLNK
ncbi:unnamed protein product [Paramecium sonneborni]|uniref:Uncharacterized protein n=1 Tax=Paramecium sonneborni TaxID=65129 RepID=A0A8S1QZT3_9CILI|nr:unnamed protein product [Paramecium sonneborni]